MAKFTLKCDSCGNITDHDYNDLDWDYCVDSIENSMGAESHHEATYENTCPCTNDIKAVFDCYEYPEGFVDSTNNEITGATLVNDDCTPCPELHSEE
jgi:hypothetical protein